MEYNFKPGINIIQLPEDVKLIKDIEKVMLYTLAKRSAFRIKYKETEDNLRHMVNNIPQFICYMYVNKLSEITNISNRWMNFLTILDKKDNIILIFVKGSEEITKEKIDFINENFVSNIDSYYKLFQHPLADNVYQVSWKQFSDSDNDDNIFEPVPLSKLWNDIPYRVTGTIVKVITLNHDENLFNEIHTCNIISTNVLGTTKHDAIELAKEMFINTAITTDIHEICNMSATPIITDNGKCRSFRELIVKEN